MTTNRDILLHATIDRERAKNETLESEVRQIIDELRAEGDRLFERYGATEARPVWSLVKRLERSVRVSEVRKELAPV